MTEIATSWRGRLRQGAAFALQVPAAHRAVRSGIARLEGLLPEWLAQRRRLGWWLNTKAHLYEILHFAKTGRRRRRCQVGAYQFNIDHTLRVGFCTESIGWIGDLNRQSAAEIWYGEEAGAARRRVGTCRDCVLNCFYTPSVTEAATDLLPMLVRSR